MRKFISTYIIAFLGYICFFVTLLWGGFVIRHSLYLDKLMQNEIRDGGLEFFYWGFIILYKYYVIHFSVLFVSFLFFIFEFINRKKFNINIPVLSNINVFFIVLGVVFTFIPIYLLIFILIYRLFL